jgi:Spy/CpxP family protein refolding chaperone
MVMNPDGRPGMQRPPMRDGKGGIREGMGKKMEELNLTEDQKQKIKTVNENFRAKYKELADQRKAELDKIYTPEQQAKLKEMRKDFSDRKQGQRSDKNRKGKDLKLDDASKDKLKALKEDFEKQKKAVELSRIAPDAQKQKIADLRKDYKEKRQAIIKEARANTK